MQDPAGLPLRGDCNDEISRVKLFILRELDVVVDYCPQRLPGEAVSSFFAFIKFTLAPARRTDFIRLKTSFSGLL